MRERKENKACAAVHICVCVCEKEREKRMRGGGGEKKGRFEEEISAPIGAGKCNFSPLTRDRPTDQPTDGHEGSCGSYTSNKII